MQTEMHLENGNEGAIKSLLIQFIHSLCLQLSLQANYYAGSCLVSEQLGN